MAFLRYPNTAVAEGLDPLGTSVWDTLVDGEFFDSAPTVSTATGTAAGSSSVAGVGAATATATGNTSGVASASGAATSTAASTGTSQGAGTATGAASSIGRATGSAAGSGSSTGAASATGAASGAATGSSTGTGAGSATAQASGSAIGTSSAVGAASGTYGSGGSSSGSSSATGQGQAIVSAVGVAAGSASAVGVVANDNLDLEALRREIMPAIELLAVWTAGPDYDGAPLNTAKPIDLARGMDLIIPITFVDATTRRPIDLNLDGGDEMVLTVRQTFESEIIFSKKATKPSFASYEVALVAADTLDLAGRLVYDLWVKRIGVNQQVVAPSYFNVTPRVKA